MKQVLHEAIKVTCFLTTFPFILWQLVFLGFLSTGVNLSRKYFFIKLSTLSKL